MLPLQVEPGPWQEGRYRAWNSNGGGRELWTQVVLLDTYLTWHWWRRDGEVEWCAQTWWLIWLLPEIGLGPCLCVGLWIPQCFDRFGWEHIRYFSLTGISGLPVSRPFPSCWLNLQHRNETSGQNRRLLPVPFSLLWSSVGASFCIDSCWELVEWPLKDGAELVQAERWWLHHYVSVYLVNLTEKFILSLAILMLVSLIFPNLDPNGGDYVWNKKLGECVGGIVLSRNNHKYWTEVEIWSLSDVSKFPRNSICITPPCPIHAIHLQGAACVFLWLLFDVIHVLFRVCAL